MRPLIKGFQYFLFCDRWQRLHYNLVTLPFADFGKTSAAEQQLCSEEVNKNSGEKCFFTLQFGLEKCPKKISINVYKSVILWDRWEFIPCYYPAFMYVVKLQFSNPINKKNYLYLLAKKLFILQKWVKMTNVQYICIVLFS